ncbi:hypothetical protein [Tropicibacter sp. S64]|uniref:hypothetical protein n=1 Tax=Tropicibacter sp. S64 TaxID=3415122 RepID=UPI003C7E0DA6
MLRISLIAALGFIPGNASSQEVLPQAIKGYQAVCLKAAPDFSGYAKLAKQNGFRKNDGSFYLKDAAARVDVFPTEQGCACVTTLVAPNPNATATAVLEATVRSSAKVQDHPNKQIAAVLTWPNGTNALQLESDTRGSVPLVRATLLSQTACPRK